MNNVLQESPGHADPRGPTRSPGPRTDADTDADRRGPTRPLTRTHADPREAPVPALTRTLTRTHADPRGPPSARTHAGTDADPRGLTRGPGPRTDAGTDADTNADPRGPTREPFPALTRTPTRTHADPRGLRTLAAKSLDASPRKRSEGGVEVAPRGSASVSASVRGEVPRGSAWVSASVREGVSAGFAWVRISVCDGAGSGPRVGPCGSVLVPGRCGIWIWIRPRGSTSVIVSMPVIAGQCGIWVGQGRCGWQGFVLFPGGLRDTCLWTSHGPGERMCAQHCVFECRSRCFGSSLWASWSKTHRTGHRTERYVGPITCKRSKQGCFFLGAKEPAACHIAMQVGLVANQALSSFKTYIYVCKNMYSRRPPSASICTTWTTYIQNHDITPPSTHWRGHWRGPTRRGFWPKIWLRYVNACRGISIYKLKIENILRNFLNF